MIYVLICSIVVVSGYLGNIIAGKFKRRVEVFELMAKFADFLSINVCHLSDEIDVIFQKFIFEIDEKYRDDVLKICKICKGEQNVTFEEIEFMRLLKEKEKNEIKNFLSGIGKFNSESQVHVAKSYKHVFENFMNVAKDEKKQKGDIAVKICVSIGVIVCILIV